MFIGIIISTNANRLRGEVVGEGFYHLLGTHIRVQRYELLFDCGEKKFFFGFGGCRPFGAPADAYRPSGGCAALHPRLISGAATRLGGGRAGNTSPVRGGNL